jgi:hypothetical protein
VVCITLNYSALVQLHTKSGMHAACVNKKVKQDLHAAYTKTQMESGDCDAICTPKAA